MLCLQESIVSSYPEPDEFNSHAPNIFPKFIFNIVKCQVLTAATMKITDF